MLALIQMWHEWGSSVIVIGFTEPWSDVVINIANFHPEHDQDTNWISKVAGSRECDMGLLLTSRSDQTEKT